MATITKASRITQPERFCKYIHRYCNQTRLDGYNYCIRHILEDKSAPFKQCTYVNQPNKKRCTNAAPKSEKNEKRETVLCPFHAKRAMLKVRIATPKKKPKENASTLLKSLEHYCKYPNHDSSHKRETGIDRNEVPMCEGGSGPTSLSDIEATFDEKDPIETKCRIDTIDNDNGFIEKYGHYLDHAGVYTHKEVLKIAQEKILWLQQLYCEELKLVYHQLRESRRKFLAEINSINQGKTNNEASSSNLADQAQKHSLHALMQYHRRSGAERVLRHRVQMKRLNANKPPEAKEICTYEKHGNKCTREVLVLTKFCQMHILSDPKQLLFKPCPWGQKIKCKQPILKFETNASCNLHIPRLIKSKLSKPIKPSPSLELASSNKPVPLEPEPFQSMDDIASLGLDAIIPGSLFGLDQYGEPGESTDTVLSEDQADLMQIQPISAIPPADILSDSRKSESD